MDPIIAPPPVALDLSHLAQQSDVDHVWTMVAAALVLMMQAGFLFLEAGQVRAKNAVNVAQKNLVDFALSTMAFGLAGFAIMFGTSHGGWFGWSTGIAFFNTGEDWSLTFFVFQLVFCGTAATIVSGAVAERMRMSGYILVTLLIALVIYPVSGHWAWGGLLNGSETPWLAAMGFMDFAGSTVVHSVGAWVGLACIMLIGARDGKFDADGKPIALHGHSPVLATVGAIILWVGWIGFNGGSTTSGTAAFASIVANTMVAAGIGGVVAFGLGFVHHGYNRPEFVINGTLAGLVAITAGCDVANLQGAALIGAIGAAIAYGFRECLEQVFKLDDPLGAVAVHGAAGAAGTILIAFLVPEDSLLAGSRSAQALVQSIGVAAVFSWCFGVAFAVLFLANKLIPDPDGRGRGLRVPLADERVGLNVSEHHAPLGMFGLTQAMANVAAAPNAAVEPLEIDPGDESAEAAMLFNQITQHMRKQQELERAQSLGRSEIKAFQSDIARVLTAYNNGDFSHKMPMDQREPELDEIAQVINRTGKTVDDALKGVNRVVGALAQGDLDQRIYGQFNGIFAEMKASMNNSLDTLSAFVELMAHAVNCAGKGDFSSRIETDGRKGFEADLLAGLQAINQVVLLSLQDITKMSRQMAKGNLLARMSMEHQGAFADLETDLNTMADGMATLLLKVAQSVRTVHSSAEHIVGEAGSLRETLEANLSMAQHLLDELARLRSEVREKQQRLAQMQEVMVTVQNQSLTANKIANEAMTRITELEASVGDIKFMSENIDELSFQTRLLSLNASVEAARAQGDAGLGFAVVAAEVRGLADRSAENAERIGKSLASVSEKVEETVATIKRSDNCITEINRVVDAAKLQADDIIDQEAASLQRMEQLADAVDQVAKATQTSSKNIENTLKSAVSLEKISEETNAQLAEFILEDDGNRTKAA